MKPLLLALYLLFSFGSLSAQTPIWQPSPGHTQVAIWPGPAPDPQPVAGPEFAKSSGKDDLVAGRPVVEVDNVSRPTMTVYSPTGKNTGAAVVVFPGGGYQILAIDLEGSEVCDWLTPKGITCVLLKYRVTNVGPYPKSGPYPESPMALEDAQRAVGLVRFHAAEWHIDPHKIGVLGFSAGGHLAGLAGTQFIAGKPDAEDPIERVSSRPNYLVLGYPWLGAISSDTSHLSYCKIFNVMDKCEALRTAYSPDLFVTKDTPPTFIYHTFTDQTVPVEQSLRFYEALVKAGVTSEMHIFANGPHGTGLGKGDPALDQWPGLLENWLRAQGLLTVDKDAVGAKP